MAQTKRKRQTKHRGNAAGSVTTRGRTSRPPSEKEQKAHRRDQARIERLNRRPTWRAMVQRAGIAAVIMLVLLLVLNKGRSPLFAIGFAVVAFVLYVPLGYYLETFFWRRRMAKQGQSIR
jgi:Flp pilus assembly protein TadB